MVFSGRLLGWLAPSLSFAIWVTSCEMHSAGSLSGSAFTVGSTPLFGVVSLALRLLTCWNFLSYFRPALVYYLFALTPDVILWCLMLGQLVNNIGPSRLWVPLFGIVSHLKSALFHGICPARF